MTNLCGHDRDVLRWALELWATVTNGGMVVYSAGTGGAKVAKANAFGDANDPAKLAEMLAARGRELGFDARCCDGFGIPKHRGEMTVIWHDDCQVVEVWCHRWHTFTMPTARDVLAAWIRLPEGLTEEAKQVLAQYNQQTRRP